MTNGKETTNSADESQPSEFEAERNSGNISMAAEFLLFIREHKKWWLIPFLIVFALLAFLAILGSSGAAPFIYPFV